MYDRNNASGILWTMPVMPFSLVMFMQKETNVLGEIKRKNNKNKGHSLMTGCEMRLGRDLIACVMGILIKAWVLPAAVPRFEAFALPCIVERATSSPTLMPYAYTPSMPYSLTKKHSTKGDATESHPVSFYRCRVLTMHGKLRSFEASKTKRHSKRPICQKYKSDHLLCLQK